MFSWLKKHFIPYDGNGHRPYLLRTESIRIIIVIIILLEIFAFLIPALTRINMTGGMAAVLPAVLDGLTNDARKIQNLPILAISPVLNKAAKMKAEDMALKGYFAHTSPEGKTPWYWLEKVGYKYQYAGENLAINFSDSKDVTSAWMASPTHKANIIKENYTEVGTGIAKGNYEGRETVFVAQVYANPLSKVLKQQKTSKPEIKKTEKPVNLANEQRGNILGVEDAINIENLKTESIKQPGWWQKLFASPRNSMNMVLFIVLVIITLVLFLYIMMRVKTQHRDLISNGLMVLAIVGAIFLLNYYWSLGNMKILEGFDYKNEFSL